MKLVQGFSDSLNILAFKWRSVRPAKNKFWILFALGFSVATILVTAFSGTLIRNFITSNTATNSGLSKDTIILWLNIFLQNNASFAMSGIFWAIIISIIIIPLVGYSFSSIIPEGDLYSIKLTDGHKISDSIFLQFVSSISFIQIMVLTALTSILTIGIDSPGFGIVVSWMVWVLAVLTAVLSAWVFEYLYRKYGVKSKIVSFAVIGAVSGFLLLFLREETLNFYGLGEKYTTFIQGLDFATFNSFLLAGLIFLAVSVVLLALISSVGTLTLKTPERPKKTNNNPVIWVRLGLVEQNHINGLRQFFFNMILRQSNIWKPLLLSLVFTTVMSVVFFGFYQILFTVSALIPIMISLVWSINFFGILGSSTMWLMSLPRVRRTILQTVKTVQHLIVFLIMLLIVALLAQIYGADLITLFNFIVATLASSLVIAQYSLTKSVYFPHRYRVHIRGESVLPPNKAFSYMIKLFIIGFLTSGIIYGFSVVPYSIWLGREWGFYMTIIAPLIALLTIWVITKVKFNSLQTEWLRDTTILQRIVKTIGAAN